MWFTDRSIKLNCTDTKRSNRARYQVFTVNTPFETTPDQESHYACLGLGMSQKIAWTHAPLPSRGHAPKHQSTYVYRLMSHILSYELEDLGGHPTAVARSTKRNLPRRCPASSDLHVGHVASSDGGSRDPVFELASLRSQMCLNAESSLTTPPKPEEVLYMVLPSKSLGVS